MCEKIAHSNVVAAGSKLENGYWGSHDLNVLLYGASAVDVLNTG
jgi:hypothetical protein